MMIRVRHLLMLAAAGAAAVVVVLWLGLVQISASSGHWAITDWVLHAVMRQSVKFHAAGLDPPDLSDPAMLRRGAGHFESGCAACHGSPARPRGPVVLSMTPHPPDLATRIDDWRPQDLFWIVKHGIKYSGMPAWPTQARDDEVWAQVAFLRALPSMDAETYAELALGGARGQDRLEAGGETTAALDGIFQNALDDCARCHSRDGLGRGGRRGRQGRSRGRRGEGGCGGGRASRTPRWRCRWVSAPSVSIRSHLRFRSRSARWAASSAPS